MPKDLEKRVEKLSVEKRAMKIVMEYEEKHNRNPRDVSKERCGYDIKSKGRCIEVKGMNNKRAQWVWISNSIVRTLGKNLSKYYVYIVYNISDEPRLKILEPDAIFKNLQIDTLFLIKTAAVNKYGKDVEI